MNPSSSPWKKPLLWLVLSSLIFLTLSGFALFFARPWLTPAGLTSTSHWIVGLLSLVPYSIYQLRHFERVKRFKGQVHFRLGLFTMFALLLTAVSGSYLIEAAPSNLYTFIDLVHLMASFALLIFLASHLVLVARLASMKRSKREKFLQSETSGQRDIIEDVRLN